jgi:hypothetical protein
MRVRGRARVAPGRAQARAAPVRAQARAAPVRTEARAAPVRAQAGAAPVRTEARAVRKRAQARAARTEPSGATTSRQGRRRGIELWIIARNCRTPALNYHPHPERAGSSGGALEARARRQRPEGGTGRRSPKARPEGEARRRSRKAKPEGEAGRRSPKAKPEGGPAATDRKTRAGRHGPGDTGAEERAVLRKGAVRRPADRRGPADGASRRVELCKFKRSGAHVRPPARSVPYPCQSVTVSEQPQDRTAPPPYPRKRVRDLRKWQSAAQLDASDLRS